MTAIDYETQKAKCEALVYHCFQDSIFKRRINGEDFWCWENADGDLFTFASKSECCVDFCLEIAATQEELDTAFELPGEPSP